MTEGIGYGDGWCHKLDFIDIKRAYFYTPVKRSVYIAIPKEDFVDGDEHRVAKLLLKIGQQLTAISFRG